MDANMNFNRVRTFVTVADERTVSKAAKLLRITQPALSRQIRDLEQELGHPLFDRIGRYLVLTSVGEELLSDCRRLLGHVHALSDRAHSLGRGDAGILKIAASPVQIESVLSTFLPGYVQLYPRVQVKVIEAVGPDALAMLERGDIHLGILLQPVRADDRHFGAHPVPPVQLLAACCPSYPLKLRGAIDIAHLAKYPLLLLDTGFVVRKTFDAICSLARIEPTILLESRAPSNLLALAEAGHGVAVIPSVVLPHRYRVRIGRITYQHRPLQEPLSVVWDRRRMLPRYAREFCELLAAHMRELFRAKL
jgi:DNA-binding transcriptional LysR family regulator